VGPEQVSFDASNPRAAAQRRVAFLFLLCAKDDANDEPAAGRAPATAPMVTANDHGKKPPPQRARPLVQEAAESEKKRYTRQAPEKSSAKRMKHALSSHQPAIVSLPPHQGPSRENE